MAVKKTKEPMGGETEKKIFFFNKINWLKERII